jgi:hypothetical protein
MADTRKIVHGHVNRVTGTTQSEINSELAKFFMDVQPDHPLYDTLKTEQLEINKGIIVINNNTDDPSIYIMNTLGDVVKISGNGSKSVNTYEEALAEASADNIGQIIFVKSNSVYDNQSYSMGPYIVVGSGELMMLSTSLATSGNVDTIVAELRVDVNEINEKLEKKVDAVSGYSLVDDKEIAKLKNVEYGAEVNAIEKIIVNGEELPIVDKTVTFTVSVDDGGDGVADGRVDKVTIEDVDGTKYLVFTFTESAEKEPIMVDVSEMFTEQYTSGNGITLENQAIAVKLGESESILTFDVEGNLTMSEIFLTKISDIENSVSGLTTTISELSDSISGVSSELTSLNMVVNGMKVIEVDNYSTALQRATAKNIGQVIKTKKNSQYTANEEEGEKTYLEGFYLVKGESALEFIVTSDGTKDEVVELVSKIEEQGKEINDRLDIVDAYTVNNQPISQEGGVILQSKDILVDETFEEPAYVMDSIREGDSINAAVRKLENNIAATVIATTASLNDMNSQINWLVDTTEPVENLLTLKPNVLHVLNTPVSDLVLSFEEGVGEPDNDVAYRYTILFRTAGNIGAISLPTSMRFTDTSLSDLEVDTNYLLEMQYNFAKWTKMKEL